MLEELLKICPQNWEVQVRPYDDNDSRYGRKYLVKVSDDQGSEVVYFKWLSGPIDHPKVRATVETNVERNLQAILDRAKNIAASPTVN